MKKLKMQACVHTKSKVEVTYDSQGAFWQEPSKHQALNHHLALPETTECNKKINI